LSQRRELHQTLEMMREELQEALREARQIKDVAIEEEILTGVTHIEKTCSNALRHFGKAESLLRNTSALTKAGR
jgi:hypothetical protein